MDQNLNLPEVEAAVGASATIDGSHLSSFVIPENDDDFFDPDAPQAVGEDGLVIAPDSGPQQLDKEAFYVTLKTLLSVPGMYDKDFAPVAVQPGEEDQARACSDAIYSLLEIWYPSALQPNSETLGHLMVAVPFIAGKVMLVRSILIAKRMKTVEPRQRAEDQPSGAGQAAESAEPKGVV